MERFLELKTNYNGKQAVTMIHHHNYAIETMAWDLFAIVSMLDP